MKIITKIFLLAVSLGVSSMLYSQDYMRIVDSMQGAKFSEITSIIENDFNGKYDTKHYRRWKFYNSNRLDENGYLQNVSERNFNTFVGNAQTANLKTTSFQGNWTSISKSSYDYFARGYSGGVGRVNCVAFDPTNEDIIYVGTPGGGVWRSTNDGGSWTPLTDGMPRLGVSGIVIDPSSPVNNRTIYILTGDGDGNAVSSIGIYVSYDNGNTWHSTTLGEEVGQAYKLIMHPTSPGTQFAVSSNGIFRTTDGWATYTQITPPNFSDTDKVTDIEFNANDPIIMYATTYKAKFYMSTNSGVTWNEITYGLPGSSITFGQRAAVAVTPANPNYVYVLYSFSHQLHKYSGLYLSTNGGYTFSLQSDSPNIMGGSDEGLGMKTQGWYDLAIAVSPTNENEVHVGGINMWKSTDAGATWTNTSHWVEVETPEGNYAHADVHALEFNNNKLYTGTDGGIYYSTNNADDWINITAGLEISQFYKIGGNPHDESQILGGAQDNGSVLMDEQSSMHQWYGADGFECMFDPLNNDIFYGSCQNGYLIRTMDGGRSVDSIPPMTSSGGFYVGAWSTPFYMDPNDSKTLYSGHSDVHKTTDRGNNWINLTNGRGRSITQNGVTRMGRYKQIKASRLSSDTLLLLGPFELFRTVDGAANLESISLPLPHDNSFLQFTMNPYNVDEIWAFNNTDVYQTENGGDTWTDITGTLPNVARNTIIYQEGTNGLVYIGTDIGVYYKDNSMSDWVSFSDGLVPVEIFELEINYKTGKIRAATFGRGVWESDIITECEDHLILSEPQSGTRTFEAQTITSTSTVLANTFINYHATDRITLKKGFTAQKGAGKFNAKLVDIPTCEEQALDLKSVSAKNLSGTYAGPMPGIIENKGETINEGIPSSTENFSFYPNPASSNITLSFTVDSEQPVSIVIMDMLGSVKDMVVSNEFLSKGEYEITHTLENLDRGAYIINYTNGTQRITKQIIITK